MRVTGAIAYCITIISIIPTALTSCEPPLAFTPPTYTNSSLNEAFTNISSTLSTYFSASTFAGTNVAIEITSSQQSLWNFYWTASNASSQAGTNFVDSQTVFRITRNTKIFTSLAILQLNAQGRIADLDDSITKYVSGLSNENTSQAVDWDRISLRSLLNEMGGIVDMCLWSNLLCQSIAFTATE